MTRGRAINAHVAAPLVSAAPRADDISRPPNLERRPLPPSPLPLPPGGANNMTARPRGDAITAAGVRHAQAAGGTPVALQVPSPSEADPQWQGLTLY